jgi:hypothetical protein
MADWFARLMQRGLARERLEIVRPDVPGDLAPAPKPEEQDVRHDRYDAIVQRLRDREVQEREAREKRHRWYRQSLEAESPDAAAEENSSAITRLYKIRTKVPCRATPAAQALLDQLRKRFAGCSVSFSQLPDRRQAVMLTGRAGATRRQIGWVEQCVETDSEHCNIANQGLSVETDDGSMLVLRFRYPSTSVRMCCEHRSRDETRARCVEAAEAGELDLVSIGSDELKYQDFTEIRAALDLRPREAESTPRLVWVTRPETDTINALQSRDYEAFYLRFKLEVQAGIWSSLSNVLATLPGSLWQDGSCYTVVREADASTRKIRQRTTDDRGQTVDIGHDRTYDAAPATDILLLHLDGDILADFAHIYFGVRSCHSPDAYFLKEEFFTVIRRFWTSAQSLTSEYGGDLPALLRMAQRAVPMPAQAPLLKQDWTNLRQRLVDRYGEEGRNAAGLLDRGAHRTDVGSADWPFSPFPAGAVNLGLRVVYRQAWRHVGAKRGELIRTVTLGSDGAEQESGSVPPPDARRGCARTSHVAETTVAGGQSAPNLDEVMNGITRATANVMKWPLDFDGSVHTGLSYLSAKGDIESECRESSRDISLQLAEIARKVASESGPRMSSPSNDVAPDGSSPSSLSGDVEKLEDQDTTALVYSELRNLYEVLTRPAEIQNVVLVAEKLPAPADINRSWVRRHDWILRQVLLDESFRDALETIGAENSEEGDRSGRDAEVESKRNRLYDHVRANIFHYQQAIWRQEDPQHRSLRYRKSGKKMPLEWQFELEAGSNLTIDELGERLAATSVDGHFAAYSGGREADLDRLIDPAGLLGYHGNYAVYRMRPEVGAADLFSMLHFFKSPYLRHNPETGKPVVDDPAKMRLCDSIAAEPDAAEVQFRRERACTISMKTDGTVIDLIRSSPERPDVERDDDSDEGTVRFELILEGAPGITLLSSNAQQMSDDDMPVFAKGDERQTRLLTGVGIDQRICANAPELGSVDTVRGAQCAGSGDSGSARGIVVTSDDTQSASLVTGVGSETGERVIRAKLDEEQSLGPERDSKAESGILTRSDRDSTVAPTAYKETTNAVSQAISLGATPADSVQVGRAQSIVERVVLESAIGGLVLSSIAGGGAAHAHERVILAAGDAQSTPSLVAGAGTSNEDEHMVLAHDEWLRPSLFVG